MTAGLQSQLGAHAPHPISLSRLAACCIQAVEAKERWQREAEARQAMEAALAEYRAKVGDAGAGGGLMG